MVKTGGTPKVPDCFQRTPKKLCIPEKAEILAVNVDSKGMSFLYNNVCVSYIHLHLNVEYLQPLKKSPSSRSPRSAENREVG